MSLSMSMHDDHDNDDNHDNHVLNDDNNGDNDNDRYDAVNDDGDDNNDDDNIVNNPFDSDTCNRIDLSEKHINKHALKQDSSSSSSSSSASTPVPVVDSLLVRKLDLRILPFLWLLYFLSFLDRVNIGLAKIANIDQGHDMQTELQIDDAQFNWCISIFFVGYCLCEVPSNIILKHTRPSVWLSLIMSLWGLFTCLLSLSSSLTAVLLLRLLLGVAEAGLFPGLVYYLTFWYKQQGEMATRIATVLTAANAAGAVGGLLATLITVTLDGVCGWHGWRWLLLMEGLPVPCVAVLTLIYLPDTPERQQEQQEKEEREEEESEEREEKERRERVGGEAESNVQEKKKQDEREIVSGFHKRITKRIMKSKQTWLTESERKRAIERLKTTTRTVTTKTRRSSKNANKNKSTVDSSNSNNSIIVHNDESRDSDYCELVSVSNANGNTNNVDEKQNNGDDNHDNSKECSDNIRTVVDSNQVSRRRRGVNRVTILSPRARAKKCSQWCASFFSLSLSLSPSALTVLSVFCEFRTYLLCLCYFCILTASYSASYFNPSIIRGLVLIMSSSSSSMSSSMQAQLLSAPPHVFAFLLTLFVSIHADRRVLSSSSSSSSSSHHHLLLHYSLFGVLLCACGYLLLGVCSVVTVTGGLPVLEYAATFATTAGGFAAIPPFLAWSTSSSSSSSSAEATTTNTNTFDDVDDVDDVDDDDYDDVNFDGHLRSLYVGSLTGLIVSSGNLGGFFAPILFSVSVSTTNSYAVAYFAMATMLLAMTPFYVHEWRKRTQ